MAFTDEDLKRVRFNANGLKRFPMQGISGNEMMALLHRLERAELFVTEHGRAFPTCPNYEAWRKSAGKE